MRPMLLVCSIYVSVMCMYCVMFELRRKSPKSPKRPKRRGSSYNQVSLRKRTLDMVMDDNLERYPALKNEHYHSHYAYYYTS